MHAYACKSIRTRARDDADAHAHVTVGSLSASTVHRIHLTSNDSPNDLKRQIGAKLDIPPERLALWHQDPFIGILRGNIEFMYFQDALKTGDHVTYLERPIPEGFEVIGECDGCGDIGHLFYGYSCTGPRPFVANCVTCGGRPNAFFLVDSDHSDEETD